MSASAAETRGRRYWIVPITRAILAAVAAVVITFTAEHSPHFGLLVFGSWAILSGLGAGALGWGRLPDRVSRRLSAACSVVGVVFGVLALALNGAGLGFLLYLVTVWALVTGFLELYAGFRLRRGSVLARDWMIMGGITVLLGVAFLLVPPDLHDTYRNAEGDGGTVTTPVVLVGVLGAYYAVAAVYLAIGAFSIKWGTGAGAPVRGSRA